MALRILELEAQTAGLRSAERWMLAREVNEIVIHLLSVINLQALGHREDNDLHGLRTDLAQVNASARTASTELLLLGGVLGTNEAALYVAGAPVVDAPDLDVTVAELTEGLRDPGFTVWFPPNRGGCLLGGGARVEGSVFVVDW